MKEKEDKKITINGTMISKVCSTVGMVCSIICLILELIKGGDNFAVWIVILLGNISLYFSAHSDKNS